MNRHKSKRLCALLISAAILAGTASPLGVFAADDRTDTNSDPVFSVNKVTMSEIKDDGTLSVKAGIESQDTISGYAVAAAYGEDGELIGVKYMPAASDLEFDFGELNGTKNVKVMWLDSFENMQPKAGYAEAAVGTDTPSEDGVSVLMTIPHDAFYRAQGVHISTDYDAISSATYVKAGNYGMAGGAYHLGKTAIKAQDGTVTVVGAENQAENKGIIWPVKVEDTAILDVLGGVEKTDEDTLTVAASGRGSVNSSDLKGYQTLTEASAYSYYKLGTEPENYLTMSIVNGLPVFRAGGENAETKEQLSPEVSYNGHHSEFTLNMSSAEDIQDKQINAVVISAVAANGKHINAGLKHVENIWLKTELGWYESTMPDLNGAHITNIRYYVNDTNITAEDYEYGVPSYSVYDYPVDIQLTPKYSGAAPVAEFNGSSELTVSGLPSNIENAKATVYYTTGGRNAS